MPVRFTLILSPTVTGMPSSLFNMNFISFSVHKISELTGVITTFIATFESTFLTNTCSSKEALAFSLVIPSILIMDLLFSDLSSGITLVTVLRLPSISIRSHEDRPRSVMSLELSLAIAFPASFNDISDILSENILITF